MSQKSPLPEQILSIDPESWTVRVGGRPVRLTYKEFRLLLFLAHNSGKVWSRSDLLQALGETGGAVGEHLVDVYVYRLRRKLGEVGRRAIGTVVRVGYRFDKDTTMPPSNQHEPSSSGISSSQPSRS